MQYCAGFRAIAGGLAGACLFETATVAQVPEGAALGTEEDHPTITLPERVPGVARAKLDDARLAAVLNWMLATYGAGQVAPGFAPFTAEEVGAARRKPLRNREEVRAQLIEALRGRGLVGADEDGLGRSPERRG